MQLKLGRYLLLLFIFIQLPASVELLSPRFFMEHEPIVFKIISKGFKVREIDIDTIDGYKVEKIDSKKEAVLINMRKADKLTQVFKFYPLKSVEIPSFKLIVDGKVEQTKRKKVKLKKVSKTISDNFDLQMSIDKQQAYIGEELKLKVLFRYKNIEDYEFDEVKFKGFSSKQIGFKKELTKEGFTNEETTYSLVAREKGKAELFSLKAEVEILKEGYKNQNNRSKYIEKVPVYSNKIIVDILPLPKGVSLIGSYKIKIKVNKHIVKAGEPVVFIVTIKGKGNLDDLDEFDFKIPNTTIYSKQTQATQEKGMKKWSKKYMIVSSENFIIPSIVINYFDIDEKTIKSIKSKEIKIEVKRPEGVVLKQIFSKNKELSIVEKLLFFLMGVFSSTFFIIFYKTVTLKAKTEKKSQFVKTVKEAKTQEILFKKIVPHLGKDRGMDRLIFKLESQNSLDLKDIKKEILKIHSRMDKTVFE